ncbi:hypothetical protein BK132_28755 [Paenibacillus sp. FSL H8-0259]|nr:hypothetical protein BK132_28755 [Paenibacillus sp. FSL H8-0259]
MRQEFISCSGWNWKGLLQPDMFLSGWKKGTFLDSLILCCAYNRAVKVRRIPINIGGYVIIYIVDGRIQTADNGEELQ